MSLSTDPRGRRLLFMAVPVGYNPAGQEQSFEETRIIDYIEAYSKTGKPPAPCPPEPTDPATRISLGLPPLFQPHTDVEKPYTAPLVVNTTESAPVKIAADGKEVFVSISCATDFVRYSFEELRCWAYLHVFPKPPCVPADFVAYAADDFDSFQNIASSSAFSPEELRLTHLLSPPVPPAS